MSSEVEGKLSEVLDELKLAMRAMQRALPRILTLKRAAEEMSISKRKLQDLLAKGVLQSVIIDGRRLVPSSEIERLATPLTPKKKRAAPKKTRSTRPADQAASVREFLKRR